MESQGLSQVIACHGCQRRGPDDGSWNKRTIPYRPTEFVCHVCFAGTRQPWREEFLLSEKAKFGTVQTPSGYPDTELDVMHRQKLLQRDEQRRSQSAVAMYRKTLLPYVHSPLHKGQIRVLDILPGEDESDVCCAVKHVDLEATEGGEYDALSYHWERVDEEQKTIWIEGCAFAVSQSLFAALKCLRDPKIPRTLWIDAISINQDEKSDEKAIQIGMMGRIYQNAFEVIIWLGPATEDSNYVMDAITDYDIPRIQSEKFAAAFSDLLRRSWFFRTWTIQEFVLVKFLPRMQCGAKVVTSGQFLAVRTFLDELRFALDKIKATVGWQPADLASLSMKGDVILEHPTTRLRDLRSAVLDDDSMPRRRSLAKILTYYTASQVKYDADKIYGTLGLVEELVHDHIKSNNTKSVSDTYTDAMSYMMNFETEEHDVEVLQLYLTFPCPLTRVKPTQELPSWVPDFAQNDVLLDLSTNYVWFWLQQTTRDGASKPRTELQHGRHQITTKRMDRDMFKVSDKVLFVRGFIVDEIAEIVPSAFCEDFIEDSKSKLDRFFEHTEEIRKTVELFKPLLDQAHNMESSETFGNLSDGPSPLLMAIQIGQMFQSMTLQQIEKTCRKYADVLGTNSPEEEWMTDIWSDLFEGYGDISKLSNEQFRAGFHYLVGSRSPKIPAYWTGNGEDVSTLLEEGGQAAIQLETPFKQIFKAPNCFFMTKTSGMYGIGTNGVMDGDKVAFLFPPFYMSFILRPHGDRYRLVGPCFVPPLRRDVFMNKVLAAGQSLDGIFIV